MVAVAPGLVIDAKSYHELHERARQLSVDARRREKETKETKDDAKSSKDKAAASPHYKQKATPLPIAIPERPDKPAALAAAARAANTGTGTGGGEEPSSPKVQHWRSLGGGKDLEEVHAILQEKGLVLLFVVVVHLLMLCY